MIPLFLLERCYCNDFTASLFRYISFCWYRNATMRVSGSRMQRKCVAVTVSLTVLVALMYSFLFVMLGVGGDYCHFIPLSGYGVKTKKIAVYALSLTHVVIGED